MNIEWKYKSLNQISHSTDALSSPLLVFSLLSFALLWTMFIKIIHISYFLTKNIRNKS